MNPKGGIGVETGRSGAEVLVRWGMLKEREQFPRCWTIQSQAERRNRGQTEESWLLFEGIDTFLYDLMRKSKKIALQRGLKVTRHCHWSCLGILSGSCVDVGKGSHAVKSNQR